MDLEQQLRGALAPTRPGPQVRAAVMARLAAEPGRRGPNRWVLAGVVLALAAAAAMFAMRLWDPAASTVAVDSSPVLAASPDDIREAPSSLDTAATGTPPVAQDVEPQPLAPAIKTFTVQVLPLKGDVVDVPRKAAIEAVYVALVDGLRAVPGLTLVEPARDASGPKLSTDYRLTLEGSAVLASATTTGDFVVNMVADRSGPDGRMGGSYHMGMKGQAAPGCTSPTSMDALAGYPSCADPVGVAGGLLAALRKMVFPPDPQLQRGLQARLIDRTLDADARLRALQDLGSFGRASGTRGRDAFAPGLRDSAVVRAAIQLAANATDPAARAQVWYTLRGSRDPELVRPLVAALRADADDDTRLQALATLVADFAVDPQVRLALETAAAKDSNPMLRALAGRSLGGESGWTEYVLASLKDASRSPVERVEALFYAYGLPTSRTYGSFSADGSILRSLDDTAMRALTEVLPRAAADSQRYAHASLTLVSSLAQMDHPAITDLLLDGLNAGDPWFDRSMAVRVLHHRNGDPRVRAILEKIAAEDANPQLRQLAGTTLNSRVPQPPANWPAVGTAAATAAPPRLGVIMVYVPPAPGVPAELVGKVAVGSMAPASVAERAGVKEGDILLEIAGKPISSGPQMLEVLDAVSRDVDVDVLVSRDGQTMRLTARF